MSGEMLVLRALHIMLGVFWAGSAFFVSSYLLPGVRRAWPASSTLLPQVIGGRFRTAIAVVGGLTILTGLRLYWRVSSDFNTGWMRSGPGLCYGVGGVAALVALGIAALVVRPNAQRLGALSQAADQANDAAAREARLAEAGVVLGRLTGAFRWIAALLGVAVLLMAVARYT